MAPGRGVDTNDFNLISTPFAANGTGVDGVLDQTGVTIKTTGIVTITGSNDNPELHGDALHQRIGIGLDHADDPVRRARALTTPVTTSTVVPTNPTQATALAGINTTITNFMNTVNLKGASLAGSDLAPYVDPNYLYNGEGASQWEANVAADLAGYALTFSGLQINSLDTSTNIADVTFQITQTKNSVTMSQPVETNFKPINGVVAHHGQRPDSGCLCADMGVVPADQSGRLSIWHGAHSRRRRPAEKQRAVRHRLGPGTGQASNNETVPVICSYNTADCNSGACPLSARILTASSSTQKAFELDLPSWPSPFPRPILLPLPRQAGPKNYTTTVTNEFGFDARRLTARPRRLSL